jgi:hypothetical protein
MVAKGVGPGVTSKGVGPGVTAKGAGADLTAKGAGADLTAKGAGAGLLDCFCDKKMIDITITTNPINPKNRAAAPPAPVGAIYYTLLFFI